MTYCGVNTDIFPNVPSMSALLSAAEMFHASCPEISGAFMKYALALAENQIAMTGSSPQIDQALAPLIMNVSRCQVASAKTLEQFGDALFAAADGPSAQDFHRIAYLCYSATSIYGLLAPRVAAKVMKAEQIVNGEMTPGFGNMTQSVPSFTPGSQPPQFGAPPPSFTQSTGPPVFTPGPQPPQFGAPPPSFTQSAGPPVFTSGSQPPPYGGPPVFTPGPSPSAGPPVFTPVSQPPPGAVSTTYQAPETPAKAVELVELASNAFNAGANDVAFSALQAAISELKKA